MIEQSSQHRTPSPSGQSRTNGLAVAALVLGLVAFVLCPFDPINALGFLCGLIGVGLAIPAVVVGARRNARVGMAVTGLVLSIVGAVVSPMISMPKHAGTVATPTTAASEASSSASSSGYSSPGYSSPTYSAPTYSAPTYSAPTYTPSYTEPAYTPPAPDVFTYRITSSGRASTITYSASGGNTSQVSGAKLPWSKKVTDPGTGGMTFAYVSAQNNGGGTISCQILGPDGQVVAENSSEGQYAIVTCQSS